MTHTTTAATFSTTNNTLETTGALSSYITNTTLTTPTTIGYSAGQCIYINSNNNVVWSNPNKNADSFMIDNQNKLINFPCVPFLNKLAVSYNFTLRHDIAKCGEFFFTVMEQDFTTEYLPYYEEKELTPNKRRLAICALDTDLNRLEFCSVYPDTDAKANLEHLVDSTFSVVTDKTDYIGTLYCRRLPMVGYSVASYEIKTNSYSDTNGALDLTLVPSKRAGIIPIIHLANAIFGKLLPATGSSAATVFSSLTEEILILDKSNFPVLQPYFSPEYGYISLDASKNIKSISRETINYTKEGLVSLLNRLCVAGTNNMPFVNQLIEHIALDQQISDPEDYAVTQIKRILETAY